MKYYKPSLIHSLGWKCADVLQQNGAVFNSSHLCSLLRQPYLGGALGSKGGICYSVVCLSSQTCAYIPLTCC